MDQSRKKVFNKEESAKTKRIKGSVRSSVTLEMLASCKSQTMVDKKKALKAGKKPKHKNRYV